MNSRVAASCSESSMRIFLQSSIFNRFLVGAQPWKSSRKHGDDSEEIAHQFLLWRKILAIDDNEFGMVSLAKGFKVFVAKANQPIPMSKNNPPDLTKFNQLHETIELFAFVI